MRVIDLRSGHPDHADAPPCARRCIAPSWATMSMARTDGQRLEELGAEKLGKDAGLLGQRHHGQLVRS